MIRLQMMIDELSKRADESNLVALLATNHQARIYNADLAREMRDVVEALRRELDLRRVSAVVEALRRESDLRASAPCQSTEMRMGPEWGRDAVDDRVYIARLNIEHYRQKLLAEQDEAARQRISQLLAEEEAKLAALRKSLTCHTSSES
jgi:hypothetical protein